MACPRGETVGKRAFKGACEGEPDPGHAPGAVPHSGCDLFGSELAIMAPGTGLGMGLATLFVLLGSNIVISLIKKAVPGKVRIPIFIVVIATFVTIIQFVMAGFFPDLNRSLGLFIPLIVVNCIILGRAEAFASKNNIYYSILDAIGMGLGFTLALVLIGSIREILGANKIFGMSLVPGYEPMGLFILPPGAFLTMGLIIAVINKLKQGKKG